MIEFFFIDIASVTIWLWPCHPLSLFNIYTTLNYTVECVALTFIACQHNFQFLEWQQSCYVFVISNNRVWQVPYYADAKQSVLEIRMSFFFFFFLFSSWWSQIVTRVVIGYTYIVANGSSCCFFIRIQGCICRNIEGFMR